MELDMKRDAIFTDGWKAAQKRTRETQQKQFEERIQKYENSPKRCLYCEEAISYKNRKNDFCGRSCSASYNNLKYPKRRENFVEAPCPACGKVLKVPPYLYEKQANKFCSQECNTNYIRENTFQKMLRGEIHWRQTLRNTLIWKFGNICDGCGITEWQGHPICLELDHKDGNPANDAYDNIWKICPNCHSVTKSWKGRNKGSGRKARGLSIH
jgi:hypothetical protein